MKKKIKLFDPVSGLSEENALKKTLKSHFWASGSGVKKVQEFEKKFTKFVGANQCVAVNSGTAALHLALSLENIKNKEVILPSLSFVSTAHSVIYNNAKPIFADIDPVTLCIDPDSIRKSLTKKTRVILPVHFAGMPCNLDKIMNLCEENNAILIEDAAHATGTTYKNKPIGSHGLAACFSFHPVKNLAMPTGGAITLNGILSRKHKEILKIRRWCGISNRKRWEYNVTELGWNYYMNEFSATIGIEQLKKLRKMNSIRKSIAKRYSKEIDLENKMPFNKECSYHFYWIQVNNRKNFMQKMLQNNVETGIHYFPIHKMKFYKNNVKLPITEQIGKKIVSLPLHPNLSQPDVDRIIKLTNKFG